MKVVPLGKISEFIMGQAPPGRECNKKNIGVPFVKAGEFGEIRPTIQEWTTSPLKKAKRTDVLICVVGATSGKLNLGEDCAIGRSVAAIRPYEREVDQRYLYNYLKTWTLRLRSISQGCAQGVITKDMLHNVPVSVPSIEEQKRITELSDQCDNALQKRREAIRLLDDFLKATFLEMFGDPAVNTKNLPEVKCGNVSTHITSGSTPLGGDATYLRDGILFIRSQNVHMNRLVFDDIAYIDKAVHNRMKRTWVKRNDVLLNITGASIGRVAYFNGEDDTANVNQHVCIIRPNLQQVLPEYLSFLISMPNFQKKVLSGNAGATRQAFNFEQIKNFIIPLARIENQKKFAAIVGSVEKLKQKMKSSETELQNLFNCLMQKAFKGELFNA